MPASSSSSSDDEDFSKFASCAVSADQLEKDAQVEAKKRSGKRAAAIGGGPTAAAPSKKQDGDEDEPTSAGVDAVSAKVRLPGVGTIPATGNGGVLAVGVLSVWSTQLHALISSADCQLSHSYN